MAAEEMADEDADSKTGSSAAAQQQKADEHQHRKPAPTTASTTTDADSCCDATAATTSTRTAAPSGNYNSERFSVASSAMDEEEDYPKTQQEELNEILEAFYEVVSDEQIREYQAFIEEIDQQSLASRAVQAPDVAPDFELTDQDGERVCLHDFCKKGPVILVFYRGKWCPHCNAVIINLQKILPQIQSKGASLIAISPMMPDGTAVFATKRCLQFPVVSDLGNAVARQYRLTFQVPEKFRALLLSIGDDVPGGSGDDSWEIPLPATYILNEQAEIVWAFIDQDPHFRAEPADILAAIPCKSTPEGEEETECPNEIAELCTASATRSFNPCNMICRRACKAPPRWRRTPAVAASSPQHEDVSNHSSQDQDRASVASDDSSKKNGSTHNSVSGSASVTSNGSSSTTRRKKLRVKSLVKNVFGRKKQEPMEFLGNYL